jgi:hypothetical protein
MQVLCVTTCFWNGQHFLAGEVYGISVPKGLELSRHLQPVSNEDEPAAERASQPVSKKNKNR